MGLIRLIARPMLASMFVTGGLDAFRNPEGKAPTADKLVGGLADMLPVVSDTSQIVKVDGAVKLLAGSTLALGVLPRLSALALAGSLVPTTLAGHSFWKETDPAKRSMQQIQFFKNVSMLGGLLLAVADKPGRSRAEWLRPPGGPGHQGVCNAPAQLSSSN
ncbi:DoxX family protein [Nakamurella lactea]|uniref:DoxX family protein n=1 Tax=Nakamurella lactea TaxID=459515 RepID=UPI0006887BC6|nr:DoxX family protein [Nakamurella lactea]